MNANVCLWVTLGCLGAACFRDPELVDSALMRSKVEQLTVRDASGAAWPADAAPRRPRFELQLERALAQPEAALFLLPGTPDSDLLADLTDPPLREATQAALLPLEVETRDRQLVARAQAGLAPGGSYTLVWTANQEPQLFPVQISESPAAGAQLLATWPAQDARDVPPNLRRVLLRFDGALTEWPAARLTDADGTAVAAPRVTMVPCSARGLGGGDCMEIEPEAELQANQAYTLSFDGELRDATGYPLPFPLLRFQTANARDDAAPNLTQSTCALDELAASGACVVATEKTLQVRGQTSEPALIELVAPPQSQGSFAFSEPFELELAPPAEIPCIFLRITDLAGHRSELPLCVELPKDLITLSIDEVRVDPLGPEPDQEYVELLNFGTQPQSMMNLMLSDDPFTAGLTLESPDLVAPGERVLLVGPHFDRHEGTDTPVPEAVKLVRLARDLSLPNGGSQLFLRDAQNRRLSAAPRLAPDRSGQCIARAGADPRSGALAEFQQDPGASCTPGAKTFAAAP